MDRPKDRLSRIVRGGGLALALAAGGTGCRSTKPEVPPHRPFMAGVEGAQAPASSLTNPSTTTDGLPPVSAGPSPYGTPPSADTRPYGAPTSNAYGAPGTSSLGTLPGGDATRPSFSPVNGLQGGANPQTGIPQTGTGPLVPGMLPGIGGAPTQDYGPR